MTISAIVAAANHQVIGKNNQMPWHLPADLRYFKQQTIGKTVIMGRKCFESIGRPLPNRLNIVLTTQKDWKAEGITIVHTREQALHEAQKANTDIMIIGGGEIYRLFLPLCQMIFYTKIELETEGDVFFPIIEKNDWELTNETVNAPDEKNKYTHTFQIWKRINTNFIKQQKKMVATHFTPTILANAYTPIAYFELSEKYAAEGRTSGDDQSQMMIDFSKLNWHRMKRILAQTTISPALAAAIQAINQPITWVLFAETWCGDAAQNLPVIAKMAALNPLLTLRILLRDEHKDLMNLYLTNGGQAIPKLIALNENGEELYTWGPRPAVIQAFIPKWKEEANGDKAVFVLKIQEWYNADKNAALQAEFTDLLAQN